MGRDEVLGSREVLVIAAIDGALWREAHIDPSEFFKKLPRDLRRSIGEPRRA
jgi:hypothetical protein